MTKGVTARTAALILAALPGLLPAHAGQDCKETLGCFLEELRPLAEAQGVSRQVFASAFAAVSIDPEILPLTRSQPEYNKPVGQYIDARLAGGAIAKTRQQVQKRSSELAILRERYGVDPEILVSIWCLESGFGAVRGSRDVIRSLATLAHAGYRGDFFRNELIDALKILQKGDVPRNALVGSWAGAMGQPQFLPSSFLRYAVDVSGDGRRDIWNNASDVLGSIANYLQGNGWKAGLPWGFEVVLPDRFDYRSSRGTFSEWRERGFRRADGQPMAISGSAYLLFPSGARGPAFLVTDNYAVIKSYNFSDPYALAVAHLADRARGERPISRRWPTDEQPLSRDDRIKLQHGLAALGYWVYNFVGHIDFDQRDAIRDLQQEAGSIPDGNPSAAVLELVRTKVARGSAPSTNRRLRPSP